MTQDSENEFDVVIIGAGVNGAGLFRDLCAQGLRCLIIDKGDFGSGTSAAPSRLIHGGLKYLETGEFRLVAESTYERNLLLRNAPHLVKPLLTLVPIYSMTKGIWPAIRTFFGSKTAPRSRGAILVKIGLRIYDFYGARARIMPVHKMLSRARALVEIPALTPDIVAAGTYYDASIAAPERLVLELIKDGLSLSPTSEAMNWTAVVDAQGSFLTLTPPDQPARKVLPKIVVNAAGPWIDKVNTILGVKTQLIGGTKGSHIQLDHPELLEQLDGRMIYFEGDDGRILLVFPFQGKALVGSTDIPADNPDDVFCSDEEISYFMQSLKNLLPGLHFGPDQIVYAYAGIRPLPNSVATEPGLVSREHSAPVEAATPERQFPIISLVGGKWTTFRAFSAEVADSVLYILGTKRQQPTDNMAIGGGRELPQSEHARSAWVIDISRKSGAVPERVGDLLDRYGTTAAEIAMAEGPDPIFLPDADTFSESEIDWIARNEHVEHLEDILLRRTSLAITGKLSDALCRQVCKVAAQALGWSAKRETIELDMLSTVLAKHHGVNLFGEHD
jgi:glycerol-3-phosphate dehydrogenase